MLFSPIKTRKRMLEPKMNSKWQKQLQCSHRIHKEIKKLKLWFSKARRGYPKLIMMATTIVLMITYLLRRMKFFILSSTYLRNWFVSNYGKSID